MCQSGQEKSILALIEEMKEAQLFKRRLEKEPERRRKNGKHSGSKGLPAKGLSGVHSTDIDLAATIRANAGYFKENAAEMVQRNAEKDIVNVSAGASNTIAGYMDHPLSEIRLKRYREKHQTSILFVVDASRSQGSHERLAFVKGAVLAILQQAYTKRDKVGVIVFGDRQAQVALPLTKSVDFAAKQMEQLAAKGNTPLAQGIRLAVTTMEQDMRKYPENLHLMVLLTDGKCNYDTQKGQPLKLVMEAAGELKEKHLSVLVVDTESSVFGMGLAKKIAAAADGEYVEMM